MKKLLIASFIIVAAIALVSTNTDAVTGQISSTVNIECPAELHANGGTLAFGLLAASTNGSCDEWTVTPFDGDALTNSGAGNGVDFLPSDHSKGSFQIIGSELIYFDVVVGTDFADPNLSLHDLTLDPSSPADPSPGTHDCDELDISVGGTLQVCEGATPGLHDDAVITITANY